jgi:lipid-A-disaccharide synthase
MRVFAGAGEASGDRILAALLRGLRARHPDLELRGFGGPLCAAEGLESPYSLRELAVNGLGDVLRRAVFLLRARAALRRTLAQFRPDLVLLVDYPGMNVALARTALDRGIPVHYVAPPQLWAYRNPARRLGRLREILKGASLQVLFPFEAAPYRSGAPWTSRLCQGHFFAVPAFEPARGTRLLLCPGSRRGVLRRNLPLWLDRARAFFGTLEGVDVLVPDYLEKDASRLCGSAPGLRLLTDREEAFARAGAAIAFPGTITLELFLRRIPVRAWAVLDPLTLWMGRRALRGPPLSLPSALAGEAVLPEWIGTARDFKRNPPEIPAAVAAWNPEATAEAVHTVWTRMGSDQGVDAGLDAMTR